MSWIRSLMMASGWSCAENAQSEEGGGEEEEKKGKVGEVSEESEKGNGEKEEKTVG